MKTLQSDLTTPEQSKCLLKLGFPAESANFYYQDYGSIPMVVWTEMQPLNLRRGILKPCWSVGRLMEIYELCYAQEFIRNVGVCLMEDVLSAIYDAINDTTDQWNFSKLE